MKWKLNMTKPKDGDKRRVIKYAWWPVVVEDGNDKYRAWFETYAQDQVYTWCHDEKYEDYGYYMWTPVKNIALFTTSV
jgi:hypothetical protein